MAEENVYANVAALSTEQNEGLKDLRVPQKRSKVTVERVALVVLSVLLLAALPALVGVSVRRSCEDESGPMEKTTTAPVVQTCLNRTKLCGVNWIQEGFRCYYLSTTRTHVSWSTGRATCRDMGGDLVKIDSREEQAFLFQTLSVEDEWFWIGLTDSKAEGDWTWTDGSSLNQNLTFWTKERDDWNGSNDKYPEGEDCVLILPVKGKTVEKCWADLYCGLRYRFVCEKEATCNTTA
ncbi:type-2 ice-structuring protein-like [Eucyclogobius newberryi]|uniref:type-2 ice-structuring protein-like n=1 Tax=Eucyclogobius newberryi TaxID=166745 RepID=UPI003B595BF9